MLKWYIKRVTYNENGINGVTCKDNDNDRCVNVNECGTESVENENLHFS